MSKQKRPEDVLGYQKRCPEFVQCPVCYGCRNARSEMRCNECRQHKGSVCDTKKHREDLIVQLIKRPTIKVDKPIRFK